MLKAASFTGLLTSQRAALRRRSAVFYASAASSTSCRKCSDARLAPNAEAECCTNSLTPAMCYASATIVQFANSMLLAALHDMLRLLSL
jgi:hypothetical protein